VSEGVSEGVVLTFTYLLCNIDKSVILLYSGGEERSGVDRALDRPIDLIDQYATVEVIVSLPCAHVGSLDSVHSHGPAQWRAFQ
jgi:hypothetical protein